MSCSVNPLKLEDGKRLSQDGYEDPGDSRVGQASAAVDNNFMRHSKSCLIGLQVHCSHQSHFFHGSCGD